MTGPRRESQTDATPKPPAGSRLPRRAWNLAQRMLAIEAQCDGQGRVSVDIVMVKGGIWVLTVGKVERVEHLSE